MTLQFNPKTETITVHGDVVSPLEMRVLSALFKVGVPGAIPAIQNHLDPAMPYQSLYALLARLKSLGLTSSTRVLIDDSAQQMCVDVWTLSDEAKEICLEIQSHHEAK